jgi:molybdopterin synthase sulfur carrier subunit
MLTTRGSANLQVRVRLGAGLARLSTAPLLTVELADGATVGELYARLSDTQPQIAPALRAALPVVGGEHVSRDRRLADRDQVALLLPVSGG